LWHHALVLMGEKELAGKVAENFRKAFWISPFRGLADVVRSSTDGSGYERDQALRPNQIFAVSLGDALLSRDQQHAVVEVVRRELLTPVGLRSLSRGDPHYHARYHGDQMHRDEAYHNGAVWGWLIGPFLEAYLRVHDTAPDAVAQARRWLSPLIDQMDGACLGQIAEIFEGDEPHRPVGCCAQAWTVAEVLRLAVRLGM
jgi:glycogen debranching enzyme